MFIFSSQMVWITFPAWDYISNLLHFDNKHVWPQKKKKMLYVEGIIFLINRLCHQFGSNFNQQRFLIVVWRFFIMITMRLLNLKLKPLQKVTDTKMSNLCGLRMFCFEGSNDYVNLFVCLKLPISDK